MELWDIYDIDRVRTGRVAQRGKPASEGGLGEGEYHLVVHICVFNGRGQLLLQQRRRTRRATPTSGMSRRRAAPWPGKTALLPLPASCARSWGLSMTLQRSAPF